MERTLSRNEAKVVLDLEWDHRSTVTLPELRDALGASQGYARKFAHQLVKKGWLERLRPGLFQLVPASRGREGVPDMNPFIPGAALVSPYFYSFGTACTWHRFTTQVFFEFWLACREERRPAIIRDLRYTFVHIPEQRFFGFEEKSIFGHPVQMATPERALLDALNRPQYAGGIGEVAGIAANAAYDISWEAFFELADRWGSSAVVQRLGYFIDLYRVDIAESVRKALLALIRPQSKIHLGSRRRWGTSGPLAQPWNVVENVPRAVLISKGEGPRRKVVFPRKEHAR